MISRVIRSETESHDGAGPRPSDQPLLFLPCGCHVNCTCDTVAHMHIELHGLPDPKGDAEP